MDLDLITALNAPKPNLTELPTLESIDAPKADPEAFTALMQDTPIAQEPELTTLEWPVQIPMSTPEGERTDPSADTKRAEENSADQTPDINGISANLIVLNNVIPRPDAMSPKVDAPVIPAPLLTGTITRPKVAISASEQVQVAVQAPGNTRTIAQNIAPPTHMLRPKEPEIKQAITASPSVTAPLASPASIAPALTTPTKLTALPDVDAQPIPKEPSLRAAPLPATQTAPPPPPALPVQFTKLEHMKDDPAEVQFSIKIERQSIEHVQSIRTPTAPTPVANQISNQLPALLTKAEKQTVELRLDPPELGRVTIHLTTQDQQVTAQVIAERVHTVDLMRQHAELLTATLARAGFSEANLSFQQGQGGEREQAQFQSFTGVTESDAPPAPAPTLIGQDGRLDIRL